MPTILSDKLYIIFTWPWIMAFFTLNLSLVGDVLGENHNENKYIDKLNSSIFRSPFAWTKENNELADQSTCITT